MINNEFKLINILSKIIDEDLGKNVGIGDDCALINIGKKKLLVTVDSMTEGVHFLRSYPPKVVGEKLATINASDIASCGGTPEFAVISLNIPKSIDKKWIKDLYKGIDSGAKKYGFKVVGGNTSSSKELSFSMTLFGYTPRFVSRREAKKGDLVFLSGKTGLSKLGLELILKGEENNPFKKDHLKPQARVDIAEFLSKRASSAIDISDGLVQDLKHICKASRVSIDVDSKRVPLSKKMVNYLGTDLARLCALEGGEDYQIAFTLPKKYRESALKLKCYEIGEVKGLKSNTIYLDGSICLTKGFDHLKNRYK